MLICAPQRKPTTADMKSAMHAVQNMRVAVRGFTNKFYRLLKMQAVYVSLCSKCRFVCGTTGTSPACKCRVRALASGESRGFCGTAGLVSGCTKTQSSRQKRGTRDAIRLRPRHFMPG